MTPWDNLSRDLAIAALKENFQVRVTFESGNICYGFQPSSDESIRTVFFSSTWGKDSLCLMSREINYQDFREILKERDPISIEIYPKDHTIFSPKFRESDLLEKVRHSPHYAPKKERVPETRETETFYNKLGYLVDRDDWVYDTETGTIFGKLSGQSPSRIFSHHAAECQTPENFYHVKILKRRLCETLSPTEYQSILAGIKKGRAGEKNPKIKRQ